LGVWGLRHLQAGAREWCTQRLACAFNQYCETRIKQAFKACSADARNPKIRVKKRDAADMAMPVVTEIGNRFREVLCAGEMFHLKYDGKPNILCLLDYAWSHSTDTMEAQEYERLYEREGSCGAVGYFGTPGAEALP
jgi:hypothetical protein